MGILELFAKQDGHGQLGQVIPRQEMDGSPLDHLLGRGKPVTEKSTAIGDDQFPLSTSSLSFIGLLLG